MVTAPGGQVLTGEKLQTLLVLMKEEDIAVFLCCGYFKDASAGLLGLLTEFSNP